MMRAATPTGRALRPEAPPEQVAACAEDGRPDDSARGIEEKELLPVVAIDASEKRRKSAQHRDEAAEKDDLAAVLEEEILPDFEPLLIKSNIMPKAKNKRKAELATDPIAAIVADDGAGRRRPDHPVNLQRTRGGED